MRNIIRWDFFTLMSTIYVILSCAWCVKHSYSLLCLFPHRVAVLDKVTDFLLFLGKLLIVGIVGRNDFIFRPKVSLRWWQLCLNSNPITPHYLLYRDFLFLLLLWKNQSSRGGCSISELLLGANIGEKVHIYLYISIAGPHDISVCRHYWPIVAHCRCICIDVYVLWYAPLIKLFLRLENMLGFKMV